MPIFLCFSEDKHTSYRKTNENKVVKKGRFSPSYLCLKILWKTPKSFKEVVS